MPNIRQRIAHYARQATKRLVPYKHELTSIAKLLGCEDKPFQCWIRVTKLQNALKDLALAVKEKDRLLEAADAATTERDRVEAKAMARWHLVMGFADRKMPESADLLVWLMSQLEAAEARLETERSALNAFQASALDLLNANERLRERIKRLEGEPSAEPEKADVAA